MKKQSDASLLYVIALTQFAMPFMFSGVGVTLPVMGAEFQASAVLLGLVETIYLGASTAFVLPVGRLADMTDKKSLFKWGLIGFSLSTLALGFVNSMAVFLVLRGLQGVSGAFVVATNMAIIAEEVSPENKGRAMGFAIGAVYAGLAAGPFIGGLITGHLGWRWVYYLGFIPLVIAYIAFVKTMTISWKRPTEKFDSTGSIIIMGAMALIVAGSALLGKGLIGYGLITIGTVLCYLFVKLEERTAMPLIDVAKIKQNKEFLRALLLQLLVYTGAFAMTFLFTLYLQTVKEISPQVTGMILMIAPIFMSLLAPVFGRMSDKRSPKMIAGMGVISTMLSIVLCVFITTTSSVWLLCIILMLSGLGFAMFSSPNMLIIMNSVDKQLYSIASSLAAGMRTMGMVVSMVIVTVVLAIKMGDLPVTTETAAVYTEVMRYSFIIFSGLSLFGLRLAFKGR
jgi:MFS family permease